jgi:ferredoxin
VDPEKCIGCGVCAVSCPEEALKLRRHERTSPFQTAMDLYGTVAKDNNRA